MKFSLTWSESLVVTFKYPVRTGIEGCVLETSGRRASDSGQGPWADWTGGTLGARGLHRGSREQVTHLENTLLLIPRMPTFAESLAVPGALGKDRQAQRPPGPGAGFQLQARLRFTSGYRCSPTAPLCASLRKLVWAGGEHPRPPHGAPPLLRCPRGPCGALSLEARAPHCSPLRGWDGPAP